MTKRLLLITVRSVSYSRARKPPRHPQFASNCGQERCGFEWLLINRLITTVRWMVGPCGLEPQTSTVSMNAAMEHQVLTSIFRSIQ